MMLYTKYTVCPRLYFFIKYYNNLLIFFILLLFQLLSDKNDNVVGYMTRYWAGGKSTGCGWCIECCNAGTYVLEFPTDATNEQKSALIGAQLLIVSVFFS